MSKNTTKIKLAVFRKKEIRRAIHDNEWWFVVEDTVAVLTDSKDTKQYINKLRKRDEELSKGWVQFVHALSIPTSGGPQLMNCANAEGIVRIIQSIPSPKAEPFKRWLAKVGYQRIQEIENPELAQKRMKELYKSKGYSNDWIEKRVRGIAIRDELTGEWEKEEIKTKKELRSMRRSGRITAAILNILQKEVRPGIAASYLDGVARALIKKYGVMSSFEGYAPGKNALKFPSVLCACVNDEIVHGVPGERVLKDGDILSIDFGVVVDGYHSDSAITVPVGKISTQAKKLITTTEEALEIGIFESRSGARLGDVGFAIQNHVESRGFSVVRDLAGHGIGRNLHEEPYVLNYGNKGTGMVLEEGVTIAIEPMVTVGDYNIKEGNDGFVYKTADGSLSAHFEHTVRIAKDGGEVLTRK